MNYAELEEEQKESRRDACRQYRGRKRKESGSIEAQRARKANRRAYAKKRGKNQFGEYEYEKRDPWFEALKEKHKGFEGTRLEKSINPPIFLTQSIRRQYKERGEN
jgi:histone acetyltransferase (RNA polymerase elongator complex component)